MCWEGHYFSLAIIFNTLAAVYILYSKKLGRFYTGSCLDFQFRFEDHLHKPYRRSFTSNSDDWQLFLLLENLSYHQARSIEKHIKKMKSKIYIQNLVKYSDLIVKLKKRYAWAAGCNIHLPCRRARPDSNRDKIVYLRVWGFVPIGIGTLLWYRWTNMTERPSDNEGLFSFMTCCPTEAPRVGGLWYFIWLLLCVYAIRSLFRNYIRVGLSGNIERTN
jgi:putative endonuclease